MNKDQVKGRVEEAKGKVKETAGRVTDKPDLEARGTAQKVGGIVQKNYGDLKEDVKDELKKER
ncbi:MAG: CsbD family protein [Steroidobacteraceae bacterium]